MVENKNNFPLYIKIYQTLKQEIAEGAFQIGDLLPSEDELEERFGASRTTIRNAVGKLENEGLILRKRGKGTIVQKNKTAQNLNQITSFTETLKEKGVPLETGSLTIELIPAPAKIISSLSLKRGEKVYLVQRTRIAKGVPIAFMNNYLLPRVVPNLERKKDLLRKMGLYQLLEEEYNLKLKRAVEVIEAYTSGPLEADLLQIPEKEPLFHTERITYLEDGTPFEVVVSVIRADKYEYKVYLEGRPSKEKGVS
ncbi:MAG: GntR family transcriptional regulator [Candidatus Atribacteria bacterium]|nr:GntR family transcriptional regulator [Candidatus Atribacteria bacterium]